MTETPKGFEDIDPNILRTQALEDWAVDVKPTDSLKKVIAALEEGGVFWEDYAERYGYNIENTLDEADSVEPVLVEREVEVSKGGAVTVTDMQADDQPVQIITAQPPAVAPNQKYLVKMVPPRENERYDVLRYTFTKKHPYALVDSQDVEYVLTHEPGFRQALPSEVQEFYG